jgi:hypothetical protein
MGAIANVRLLIVLFTCLCVGVNAGYLTKNRPKEIIWSECIDNMQKTNYSIGTSHYYVTRYCENVISNVETISIIPTIIGAVSWSIFLGVGMAFVIIVLCVLENL